MTIIEQTYTGLKSGILILYVIIILGVWKQAPEYLLIIENIFTLVIAFVLLYFFNPFVKTICNNFHRKVAFSAGIVMVLQISIFQFLNPKNLIHKVNTYA